MWHFAWMLGLPLAATFAILNAMWYGIVEDAELKRAEPVKASGHSPGAR